MKQNNFLLFWLILLFIGGSNLYAQQNPNFKSIPEGPLQLTVENQRHLAETGYVRCATVEVEELRRQNNPNIQSKEDFENWLAPLAEARKQRIASARTNGTHRGAIINIPIIFHVLAGSPGDVHDISAEKIQAQIDQLNLDFNNLSGSTHPAAASAEINFIPAVVDPDGNILPEPGIDRQYGYTGALETAQLDNSIKPATIWDRSLYANIWTANLEDTLLGYAQFPSNSTLPGMDANNGSALTDGVVVLSGSVGSLINEGTATPYNKGRTLTHEMGHWLGLRHIWGDTSNCTNDDYCADTPDSNASNSGCPTIDRCSADGLGPDMVENYMDYTNDACMNIFTADQVNRIITVLENADGISNLQNSTTGNPEPIIAFRTPILNEMEGTGCNYRDLDIPIQIGKAPSADATITFTLSGTATNMTDFELVTPTVTFTAGSNDIQTLTLRVFEDSFIEDDETIIVYMTLATSGDAELATNGSQTLTYTIVNDDTAPTLNSLVNVFSDGFETYNDFASNPVGGWTMKDMDGSTTYGISNTTFPNQSYTGTFIVFNPSLTSPSLVGENLDTHSGSKGYYCFAATTPDNNDYIFTPQILLDGIDSELKFWARSATAEYGLERFRVGVSTTDTNPDNFTYLTASPYAEAPDTWTEFTYDLSAYNGQDVYITIHVLSSDAFAFMLDDVSVTTYKSTTAQTAVNPGASARMQLSGVVDVYSYDNTSGNIMARLENNDSFDYGCLDISVIREGSGSQVFVNTNLTEFAMDKVFNITTENANTNGDITISFYFTKAEIAGWETATGKNRTELYIFREVNGTVEETIAATVGNFGDDIVTLKANFTDLNGTFYFGPLNASSSLQNDGANNFSVYPNPASNQLTIKAHNILPDSYTVYNILGQVVLSNEINNGSDLSINTSYLSKGMYFIKLYQASNQVSIPFIKK
ncbi:T9SS-dependent choice-of-anchor J family protein [Bizionia argentinensis]|nr:choice-of-anchor J domain-containing protein [Bizionia argentinensis]